MFAEIVHLLLVHRSEDTTPGETVIPPSRALNKTVITFDDLHDMARPTGPLPSGYPGFTWCENAWFLTKGYYSTVHTGHRVVLFNAHGGDLFFEREPPFDLTGLSLSSIREDTATVLVEGWEKGSNKYSRELTVYRNAVARPKLSFKGIDRVSLSTGGVHVMVEDVSVLLEEANGDS